MKKVMMFVAAVFLISFTASAQKGNNEVSVGLDVGFPMGDFGDMAGIGFGGTVKGMYGVGSAGQAELTLGYLGFGYKDIDGSTGMIPIMFGYRHHLNGGIYLEPQLGFTSVSAKVKMPSFGSYGGGTVKSSSTQFSYAIGAGYLYKQFDFSLRYQSVSGDGGSLGFFGLRVGYNFGIDL